MGLAGAGCPARALRALTRRPMPSSGWLGGGTGGTSPSAASSGSTATRSSSALNRKVLRIHTAGCQPAANWRRLRAARAAAGSLGPAPEASTATGGADLSSSAATQRASTAERPPPPPEAAQALGKMALPSANPGTAVTARNRRKRRAARWTENEESGCPVPTAHAPGAMEMAHVPTK